MPYQKVQKIDLSSEYPCPCRRRGYLVPITLTEAFGCNRCQKIFVVEESGYVIEELSTTSPYRKAWRWTGYRWVTGHNYLREIYIPVALFIIIILPFFWLVVALPKHKPTITLFLIPYLLVVLFVLWTWLTHRR